MTFINQPHPQIPSGGGEAAAATGLSNSSALPPIMRCADAIVGAKCHIIAMLLLFRGAPDSGHFEYPATSETSSSYPTSRSDLERHTNFVLISGLLHEIRLLSSQTTELGLASMTEAVSLLLRSSDVDGWTSLRRFVARYSCDAVRIIGGRSPVMGSDGPLMTRLAEAHAALQSYLEIIPSEEYEDEYFFARKRLLTALSSLNRLAPKSASEVVALAKLVASLSDTGGEIEATQFERPLSLVLIEAVQLHLQA